MRIDRIHNSLVFYDENYLYYVKDYYDYLVSLIKDQIYLNPNLLINVIVGNYGHYGNVFQNTNPIVKIGINFEHTLVLSGGRDAQHASIGTIVSANNTPYLIRIDNYDQLMSTDIVVDYSFPNLINIESTLQYAEYRKKTICISPMLYPFYNSCANRNVSSLTTFINTEEPRRKKLLSLLPQTHININNCFERNAIVGLYTNTKILINIHQTDHHHTCEELRILPALLCGVIVISEESPLKEHIPYHNYIIWTKYENIADTLKIVEQNYHHYYMKIFGKGEVQSIFDQMNKQNRTAITEMLVKHGTQIILDPVPIPVPEPFIQPYSQFGIIDEQKIVITHNAGFFSCCSVLLHLIVQYINFYKKLPLSIDTRRTLEWYKPDNDSRDIFPNYFICNDTTQIEYTKNICYIENDQFKPFDQIDFEPLYPLISKYFSPSLEIQKKIEELEKKYEIDYENTCVLFLRGNDKATECKIPEYDLYMKEANKILETHPSTRFMIQSDETEFLEKMTQQLENTFYCKDEIRHIGKSNTTVDIVFRGLNYTFSKNFLAITHIMSKCKWVVCNSGNCSIWVAFFRGNQLPPPLQVEETVKV